MLTHKENVEELAGQLGDENSLPTVVIVDFESDQIYEIMDVRSEYMEENRVIVEITATGKTLERN